MKGKLYLIPSFIGNDNISHSFPEINKEIIQNIVFFVVEEIRTARRFIRKVCPNKNIDDLTFFMLNEHTIHNELARYLSPCHEGHSVGILSEAGVPCIADPGSELVFIAHKLDIEVIPLIGPSSILMALMASGLNGQNFAFVGYLPIKKNERQKAIHRLEQRSFLENQTQCFIEAPYRNHQLLSDILQIAHPDTQLCIAYDLTLPSQFIKTLSIKEWKNKMPDFQKHPAIFLLKRG